MVFQDDDMAGRATIGAGGRSVYVSFNRPFASTPIVQLTPIGKPDGFYYITSSNTQGFTIELAVPATKSQPFNWLAIAVTGIGSTSSPSAPSSSTETPPESPVEGPLTGANVTASGTNTTGESVVTGGTGGSSISGGTGEV